MQLKSRAPEKGFALSILLALLFGALSWLALPLSMLVFVTPVLFSWLYARSGIVPVAAGLAAQTASLALLLSGGVAVVLFVATGLPLLYALDLIRRRLPFGEQLRRALPGWILCFALSVALGQALAGQNLIDGLIGILRASFETLPVSIQDVFLQSMYGEELPGAADAAEILRLFSQTALTDSERATRIARMFTDYGNAMRTVLPGAFLSASVLTGILACAWPNRYGVKKGTLPAGCYIPLCRWHLPMSATFGLIGVYLAALVLEDGFRIQGAIAVTYAAESLAVLAFLVQAAGSLERWMLAANRKPGLRVTLILLALLLPVVSQLTLYYGMLSALGGRHYGAIPALIRKYRENHPSGDD